MLRVLGSQAAEFISPQKCKLLDLYGIIVCSKVSAFGSIGDISYPKRCIMCTHAATKGYVPVLAGEIALKRVGCWKNR